MIARTWKKLWGWISQPHATLALGVLVGGGIIAGAVGLFATNEILHATSTDSFCVSCHELEVNIGVDYRTRSHAVNEYGIRATCADCHIAHAIVPKLIRKAEAVREIYHHVLGTIDTPEKFEAHRMYMATRVWRDMQSNDSRECRSCHDTESWVLSEQSEKAQEFHGTSMTRGKTCIDCHKGVAHVLPEGIEEDTPLDEVDESSSTHASLENQP